MLDIDCLLGLGLIVLMAFVFGVLFNPHFWASLRNSKFIDDAKKKHDKIPDIHDFDDSHSSNQGTKQDKNHERQIRK